MAYNKIIYGGTTLIDLTEDTVDAESLLSGKVAHGADGEIVNGAMPERGAVQGTIATKTGEYTIAAGHHSGAGKVSISGVEQAKIIPENIKNGVSILGVVGALDPVSLINAQAKVVTPGTSAKVVQADAGYDYLSAVTVNAIPYTESDNSAGGKTVTIAEV